MSAGEEVALAGAGATVLLMDYLRSARDDSRRV
jgi:hypothetical protein